MLVSPPQGTAISSRRRGPSAAAQDGLASRSAAQAERARVIARERKVMETFQKVADEVIGVAASSMGPFVVLAIVAALIMIVRSAPGQH
jgi:hypothetical protein